MRNILKNNKGITIVALVVTVIILMILSAITISQIADDNGIIRKAFEAKDVQEQDQKREEDIMNEIRQEVRR